MRATAVRLVITYPENHAIQWPQLCCACGETSVAGTAPGLKQAPPLPFCRTCLRVHKKWTRWIRFCIATATVLILGPLLYMGAILDRPVAAEDAYSRFHLNTPMFMLVLVFFLIGLAAIAAAIGYIRRGELQGVQINSTSDGSLDDPQASIAARQSLVEIRFKNPQFYSATLEANSP